MSTEKATDFIETEAQWFQRLHRQGLTAVDVKGDGNCLFRALSIVYYQNENKHVQIRKKCAQFIAKRPHLFEGFALEHGRNIQELAADLAVPAQSARDSHKWGGYESVLAFSSLHSVSVRVYYLGRQTPTVLSLEPFVNSIAIGFNNYDHFVAIFEAPPVCATKTSDNNETVVSDGPLPTSQPLENVTKSRKRKQNSDDTSELPKKLCKNNGDHLSLVDGQMTRSGICKFNCCKCSNQCGTYFRLANVSSISNYFLPGAFSTISSDPPKRVKVCQPFFLGALGITEDSVHLALKLKFVENENQESKGATSENQEDQRLRTREVYELPSEKKDGRTKSLSLLDKITNVVKTIIDPNKSDSFLNDVKAILKGKI